MVVAADTVKMDPKALQRVAELFQEQIEQRVHPGAALAVYRHGKQVLDLYGGIADEETGKPVAEDTMFLLFSSTKPIAAACLHLLWERGKLGWDDSVAGHWPEFGQNGKEQVTIRHILTHRGGFPDTPNESTWDKWHDWEFVTQAIERTKPIYEPGKVIAYHPRNFGWVIGELVRRIDGRPIDQFLQEEITGPLSMEDTYVGLPESLEDRVSKEHAMEDCDRMSMVTTYNKPEVHSAVQPAGGGISTARDLARFYAMMVGGGFLDGTRVFRAETIREVTNIQVEGMDHTLERPVQRSLGLSLADVRTGDPSKVNARTFGHGGAGTSVGWGDRDLGLAVGFITNGFRAEHTNTPRLASISQGVRDACR